MTNPFNIAAYVAASTRASRVPARVRSSQAVARLAALLSVR